MYNSLIILLHRPFVSDGHLQSASETTARAAFSKCAAAATDIDRLLHIYRQNFCLGTVPYFVSYATYVAGTIHVRLAAQKKGTGMATGMATGTGTARRCLRVCLDTLGEQQRRCHGPRRTLAILVGLCARLGVDVGRVLVMGGRTTYGMGCEGGIICRRGEEEREDEEEQEEEVPRGGNGDLDGEASIDFDALMGDVDMEEILRSFDAPPPPPPPPAAQTDGASRPAWDADPGTETWVPGAQDQVLYYPDSLFGFGLWSA